MNPGLLSLQSLVFLAWAVLMFRTIFGIRRRVAARTGATFPGPVSTLGGWAEFLRAPEHRSERRLLGAVTLALFALIGLNAWMAAAAPPAPVAPGFPMPPVSG